MALFTIASIVHRSAATFASACVDIDKLPSAPHTAPASSSRSLAAQPGGGAVVLRTGNADAEAVKKPIHGDVVQRPWKCFDYDDL
jgi:hypothetical protein